MSRPLQVIGWPAFKTARQNPYQALLYSALQERDIHVVECTLRHVLTAPRGAILHLHWPDAFLANAPLPVAMAKLVALRLLALWCAWRGIRWVWTAHNLQRPTQRHARLLNALFWPWFAQNLAGILYLSEASRRIAGQRFPVLMRCPSAITPHGTYPVELAPVPATNREELLFFGGVSPYKRVGDLVRAFTALDRPDLHLRITGASSKAQPDSDIADALASIPPHLRASVTREDRFLDDTSLAARVQNARLIVLPFEAVQNSGSALYALSCHRPILVPNLPSFQELRARVGAQWVHLFDGCLAATDLEAALRTMPEGLPDLRDFAWPEIAKMTEALFLRAAPQ